MVCRVSLIILAAVLTGCDASPDSSGDLVPDGLAPADVAATSASLLEDPAPSLATPGATSPESATPATDQLAEWRISEVPSITIGAEASGPTADLFGAVPAMFSDGSMLTSRQKPIPAAGVGEISRPDIELVRQGRDGQPIAFLGLVPGPEMITTPGLILAGYNFGLMFTLMVVHGTKAYVVTGDAYEVRVFDADQGYVGSITSPHSPIPYPASEVVDRFADTRFSMSITRANLRNWPTDKVYPAVSDVRVDELGNVWVAEYTEEVGAQPWRIFLPSGDPVAVAMMPSRFVPYQILADAILGVWHDELDVERVQVRPVIKPDPF